MKTENLIVIGILIIAATIVGGAVFGRGVPDLYELVSQLLIGLLGFLARGVVDGPKKEQGQ
jgi:hypothetical protein